jgi:hypothetical protein
MLDLIPVVDEAAAGALAARRLATEALRIAQVEKSRLEFVARRYRWSPYCRLSSPLFLKKGGCDGPATSRIVAENRPF